MKKTANRFIWILLLDLTLNWSRAFAELNVPDLIKEQSGCFLVDYRFIEDGKKDFNLPNNLERIDFSESNGVYVTQHYGIIEGELMKHFREEWSQTDDGRWKQRVVGPFDDLRYECIASFRFRQWGCTVPKAPKPLRDKNRTDYTSLDRGITLQITPNGWLQAENNVKRAADGTFVSNELGWVEYRKIDDSKCKLAE